jgi:pseudouridine-5'-phosphate glycosidase
VAALKMAPEVERALQTGKAVVALESAVITHGLPQLAAIEAVNRQWAACEKAGAQPAVIAVWDAIVQVGLSLEACAAFADSPGAVKVSPWNLAAAIHDPGIGGTTVAATIVVAAQVGIRIMSTGGIGGVHPGAGGEDVSADLTELSRRQVCVVCAGPKSTLDAQATLEGLETLGVPVIGWRSSHLAGFVSTSTNLRLPIRADTVAALASIVSEHWALGGAGVVVSQPIPADLAIPRSELIDDGEPAVRGPERTPAELRRLQGRLGKRLIDANIALLEHNASLAGSLAVEMTRRTPAKRPGS